MIKINLLPPYVLERQAVRRLMALFAALLVFVVAACAGVWWKTTRDLNALQKELDYTRQIEQQVNTTKSQASSELAKVGPISTKVKFIEDVMAYNTKAPALYEELARFTYEKIRYRDISLSDTDMNIQAYAPSLADAGRYLLNLYRATHIFSQVSMSAVPGYSSGGGQSGGYERAAYAPPLARPGSRGFDFTVNCKLAQPLAAPSYGTAAATDTGVVGVQPPVPGAVGPTAGTAMPLPPSPPR